jgi:hypothetical protein
MKPGRATRQRWGFVTSGALALGLLPALAACKRREPPLPATPYPKAKLAYRVGNCVYMDLTHGGEPERGRCFGLPGEPMLAHDFDGNGTADLAVLRGNLLLIDTANDGQGHEMSLDLGDVSGATQLVVGDFSGTADRPGPAAVAVRRGARLSLAGAPSLGAGRSFGDGAGEYFAGRWRAQGPARFGARHGDCVELDEDGDDRPDRLLCYGELGAIDQVLVGDWDGDGRDDLLLRRGACVFVDTRLDGTHTAKQCLGEGKGATDYFAGSWDGK